MVFVYAGAVAGLLYAFHHRLDEAPPAPSSGAGGNDDVGVKDPAMLYTPPAHHHVERLLQASYYKLVRGCTTTVLTMVCRSATISRSLAVHDFVLPNIAPAGITRPVLLGLYCSACTARSVLHDLCCLTLSPSHPPPYWEQGLLCAHYPVRVLGGSLLLIALCCIGFVNFRQAGWGRVGRGEGCIGFVSFGQALGLETLLLGRGGTGRAGRGEEGRGGGEGRAGEGWGSRCCSMSPQPLYGRAFLRRPTSHCLPLPPPQGGD